MFAVVKAQLVSPEIDYEFERAGRENTFGGVLWCVAFKQPEAIYKLRKRRLRFVKVEQGVDLYDRKLLGLAGG